MYFACGQLSHGYAPVVGHVQDSAVVVGSFETVFGKDCEPAAASPHKGFSIAARVVTLLYATELLGERTAGCVALGVNRAKVDNTKTVWRFEDLRGASAVPTYQDDALIVEDRVTENHSAVSNKYGYAGLHLSPSSG